MRHQRHLIILAILILIGLFLMIRLVRQANTDIVAEVEIPMGHVVEIIPEVRAPAPIVLENPESPETVKVAAKNRPTWVDTKPGFDKGVYRTVVVAGPYETRRECDENLDAQLHNAAADFIDRTLGEGVSKKVSLPTELLRAKHAVMDEWEEPIWSPRNNRQMVQLHALVAFDKQIRNELDRRWHDVCVQERLGYTAGFAASLLGMLGAALVWLRRSEPNAKA